jgi:phosphoglycolate phosphatase-like HAD superfamily hydrolase
MAAGVKAGALIILGVTSGAHDEEQLWAAGATHVAESVKELLTLID